MWGLRKLQIAKHRLISLTTEAHFDGVDFGLYQESCVLYGLTQSDAFAVGDFLALTPDNPNDVDVTEADNEGGNHENVRREKREIRFTLPPGAVSSTQALVFQLTIRIHPDRHLENDVRIRSERKNYSVRYLSSFQRG